MRLIFLSHSSLDNAEAFDLRDWLVREGWSKSQIFLGLEDIGAGERWRQALNHHMDHCVAAILCLSDNWINSPECLREHNFAEAAGKVIIPVFVKPVTVRIPDFIRDLQIADLSDPARRSEAYERLSKALRSARVGPLDFRWPPDGEPDRSPYRGLKALEEKDAAVFFGRDAQITAGLDAIRRIRDGAPKRILTVVADSGAGKSSFLRAGLLARLRRDVENYMVLPIVRPSADALDGEFGLLRALGHSTVPTNAADLVDVIVRRQQAILLDLRKIASAAKESYSRKPPSIVLPIDQTEEFFGAENATGRAALDILAGLLSANPDIFIIATIRSDSLSQLTGDVRFNTLLEPFLLPALPPAEFKEVIVGPARHFTPSLHVEPALTERLIADLDRADALPLLAFTLERLARQFGNSGRLALADYEQRLGGVSGAINIAVDAAFSRALNDPSLPKTAEGLQSLARALFLPWLVQLDDTDATPKRRVARIEQLPKGSLPLARHFVEERLLVASARGEDKFIEVSHEAVLRHWRNLALWIDEERISLDRLQRVHRAATEYANEKRDYDKSELLVHHGERLRQAEALLARPDFAQALGPDARAYLYDCRRLETEQQEREKKQRLKSRGVRIANAAYYILTLPLVLFVALVVFFYLNPSPEPSSEAVAESVDELPDCEAYTSVSKPVSVYTRDAVFRDFSSPMGLAAISRIATPNSVEIIRYRDQPSAPNFTIELASEILSASFSRGGDKIVVTQAYGPSYVWRRNGETKNDWGHEGTIGNYQSIFAASAFMRDGVTVVTGSADGKVELWRPRLGKSSIEYLPEELGNHSAGVNAVLVQPTPPSILATSREGAVSVWREPGPNGGWPKEEVITGGVPVVTMVVSETGDTVLTWSTDNVLRALKRSLSGEWRSTDLLTLSDSEDLIFDIHSSGNLAFATDGYEAAMFEYNELDGKWRKSVIESAKESVSGAFLQEDNQGYAQLIFLDLSNKLTFYDASDQRVRSKIDLSAESYVDIGSAVGLIKSADKTAVAVLHERGFTILNQLYGDALTSCFD